MSKELIPLVVPCFNEEKSLSYFYDAICNLANDIEDDIEFGRLGIRNYSSFIPLINIFLNSINLEIIAINSDLNIAFANSKYLFYPIIGYYIDKNIDVRKFTKWNIGFRYLSEQLYELNHTYIHIAFKLREK